MLAYIRTYNKKNLQLKYTFGTINLNMFIVETNSFMVNIKITKIGKGKDNLTVIYANTWSFCFVGRNISFIFYLKMNK